MVTQLRSLHPHPSQSTPSLDTYITDSFPSDGVKRMCRSGMRREEEEEEEEDEEEEDEGEEEGSSTVNTPR